MKRIAAAVWLVAPIAVSACTAPPRSEVAETETTLSDPAATAAPRADASSWTVTPAGIGPLRAGMSVDEARAALGGKFTVADSSVECEHVVLTGLPGHVLAMVVAGHVVRVEVRDSLVATSTGARVGDSEARIDSLYPGRVEVQPHKYTDGHYLIVTSEALADSANRLIFETDGRRVLEYRAGLLPAVAWVEGCS